MPDINIENKKKLPVGFFDSGVGGISVLREAVRLLPGEDYYYFGDSANAPYGVRSEEEVRSLVMKNVEHMVSKGIKALVVACNTATSAAIVPLRETYKDMPVIGIEPALKPAVHIKEHPSVIVMATPGTVAGGKFHHLEETLKDEACVYPLGCPGLMEYVERGVLSGEELENHIRVLLDTCPVKKPDAIVLGCTHYPFVRSAIKKIAGENIPVLDGSLGTVRQLKRLLERDGLIDESKKKGQVIFEMSLPGKEELCRKLLAL